MIWEYPYFRKYPNVLLAFTSDHHVFCWNISHPQLVIWLGFHSWCLCQSCGHGRDLSTGAIEDQFVPLAAMDDVTKQHVRISIFFGWSKTCFKSRWLQMQDDWLSSIKFLMNMLISQLHCGHHGLGQTIRHSGSQFRWILEMPRNC